ncbi:MAG: FHA domain-containing protein [Planctomycetota bacterium]|nr:MAG: FHA domain-containing protein [Planctomycetota bacterium]
MDYPQGLRQFFQAISKYSKEEFLEIFFYPFLLFEGEIPNFFDESSLKEAAKRPTQRGNSSSLTSTRLLPVQLDDSELPFTPVEVDTTQVYGIIKSRQNYNEPVILGRDYLCDVILPFPDVSACHAQISWKSYPPIYQIMDMDSTNGTYVNSYPLPPNDPHPLCDQDMIQLGSHQFIFFSPESIYSYARSPLW